MKPFPSKFIATLNDLQVLIYRLFGLHGTFQLRRLPPESNAWDNPRPWLCEIIRLRKELGDRCALSETELKAGARFKPACRRCHAGLRHLAVPLRWKGRLEGHLILSPARHPSEPPAKLAGRVLAATGPLRHPEGFPVVLKSVQWFVEQMPAPRPEELNEIAVIADSVFRSGMTHLSEGSEPSGYPIYATPVRSSNDVEGWAGHLWGGWIPGTDKTRPDQPGLNRATNRLLIAVQGDATVWLDGKQFKFRRRHVAIVPPGHTCAVQADSQQVFLVTFTTGVRLDDWAMRPFSPKGVARSLLDSIVRGCASDWHFGLGTAGRMRMLEFLLELRKVSGRPAGGGRPASPRTSAAVARTCSYLERNLTRKVDLGELSSFAGLNRYSLCRQFRREIGCSPIAYHRGLKLNEAARLLSEGTHAVKAVAYRLGFTNPRQFSRLFKQVTGRLPSKYPAPDGGGEEKAAAAL